MVRKELAGGVILNEKREIILVYNHETDSWTYPKGHVEEGENYLETAKREIFEEAGIKNLELICKLPIYERPTRQKEGVIKVMHMFLFKTKETDIKSNTNDILKVKWVPINEIVNYFSYQEEVNFFNEIKERL